MVLCCPPATASGQAARRLGGSLYEHPSQPEAPPVSPSVEAMSQDTWEEGTGGCFAHLCLVPCLPFVGAHLGNHLPSCPRHGVLPMPTLWFSPDSGSIRVQLLGYGSDERRGPGVGGTWRQGRLGQLVRRGCRQKGEGPQHPNPGRSGTVSLMELQGQGSLRGRPPGGLCLLTPFWPDDDGGLHTGLDSARLQPRTLF